MSDEKIEFISTPFGRAVKAERKKSNFTREEIAEQVGISVRYLAEIENTGHLPSLRVFYKLVRLFNLSADQFLFPEKPANITSKRRAIDAKLDELSDDELHLVEGTITAILDLKKGSVN